MVLYSGCESLKTAKNISHPNELRVGYVFISVFPSKFFARILDNETYRWNSPVARAVTINTRNMGMEYFIKVLR